MKRGSITTVVIVIIIILALAGVYLVIKPKPLNCDDVNICTRDFTSASECKHENLNGEIQGCSGNAGKCKIYSCQDGNCAKIDKENCCGNKKCELEETFSSCPEDCEETSYKLHEWGVLMSGSVRTTMLQSWMTTVAKPIIYLYSQEDFNLSLSVEFENGNAVEVWPIIPTGKKISWDFKLTSDCNPTSFPKMNLSDYDLKEIYEIGEYVINDTSCINYNNVKSKILFYNGKIDIGKIITASYITQNNTKVITIKNNLNQDISNIYLNYKDYPSFFFAPINYNDTYTVGSLKIDSLKSGEQKTIEMNINTYNVSNLPAAFENQKSEFKQDLINAGLYTDEASKFMLAWESTFFDIQSSASNIDFRKGMNVIFILPEEKYNALFNLKTSIQPTETVRVGVAYMSIEQGITGSTTAGTTIGTLENCDNYFSQIKSYCNPLLGYDKLKCEDASKKYESKNCSNSTSS